MQDNIFRRKKRKNEELDEDDTTKDEEDAMPDRVVKKAFSEPEMHARCEEEAGGDPQMKGYKRMTVVGKCYIIIVSYLPLFYLIYCLKDILPCV